VAEQASGIDLMRRRIERASRQAPPSRHPRAEQEASPSEAGVQVAPGEAPEAAAPAAPASAAAEPTAAGPARRTGPVGERGPRLAPDLPPVNLAIRVRKPLDDRLADTIHALRGQGVRTSKVELIEMLLWESATADASAVRERLRVFREWAPRGATARIESTEP
jgi:hypothetical protein